MTIYPNVPIAPGVPPIPRNPLAIIAAVDLLTEDALSLFAFTLQPTWGIFLNGVPVVEADNVVTMDYKQEFTISDYQVEGGGFQDYDKVQLPFDIRLRFSKGGSETDRQIFLNSIASIAGDLNFYTVYTPESMYPSVNIQHWDYARKANQGLGLLTIDVWMLEIRVTATTTFQNVANPASANQVSNGQEQPMTPNQVVQQEFSAGSF